MLIPRSVLPLTKCCDDRTSRYALQGVRFTRNGDGRATATATDGRRLVQARWCEKDEGIDEYPTGPLANVQPVESFT